MSMMMMMMININIIGIFNGTFEMQGKRNWNNPRYH